MNSGARAKRTTVSRWTPTRRRSGECRCPRPSGRGPRRRSVRGGATIQWCALTLGEAGPAGVAVELAELLLFAVVAADREVAGVTFAVERTAGILAAETCEVVHEAKAQCKEATCSTELRQSHSFYVPSLAMSTYLGHDRNHGKENPNQLPLSVSFPGATPARRVGSFRGYPFVMIFLAGVTRPCRGRPPRSSSPGPQR